MEFSKYIVPIISGKEYYGTGFLYKDYLITANHVVNNKISSFFRLEGDWYKIRTDSFIVLPSEEKHSPNEAQDLFVCKTDFSHSDLQLSCDVCKEQEFEYQGYFFDDSSNDFVEVVAPRFKLYHEIAYNKDGDKMENCFSCKGELKPSNSGGPLFQNNKITGMLIRTIKHQGGVVESIFIKADYILNEIEEGLQMFNELNQSYS